MLEKEILEKVCNKIFYKDLPVLETGFEDLDIMLKGLEKSSIITIGARPSMGKTALITTIMLNLLEQNKKCLFFSLGMSKEQFLKRLLVHISEVDFHTLNNIESLNVKIISEKIKSAIDKLCHYNIDIYDNSINTKFIEEKVKQNNPDYIFVDSIQLIKLQQENSHSEAFEKVMTYLKQIAKNNNCIIFITSQISRAVENRKDRIPLLSDFKDGDAIENKSDIIIFIHRPYYYDCINKNNENNYKNKTELIIAKNKYGPIGAICLNFKSSIMKFFNPTKTEIF